MTKLFGFACMAALACVPAAAHAQAAPVAPRIVGNRISGGMQLDAKAGIVTETVTLTFAAARERVYTIDFVVRHPVQEPVPPSNMVDIVVTERQAEDAAPEMVLRVDGETLPLVARPHGTRSVVATVSVAEFDRIARAGTVVDRTFGTELELGAGQAGMLRATADRWLGRGR